MLLTILNLKKKIKMENLVKCLIIALLAKQSICRKCEFIQLESKVECRNSNIKSILSILNSLIEILDLSFNKLEDKYIQEMLLFESLKELNVSHNELLVIKQDEFNRLNKLEILDLSFNQIYWCADSRRCVAQKATS